MTETVKDQRVDWPWWYSTDEERYRGPCSSRADAIMEAWAEYPDVTAFHLIQAEHGELSTAVFDHDQISEAFDELNEEAADGDGDSLSAGIPDEEWKAIAESLSKRIKAAIRKHGVKAWGFARQTSGEWVDLAQPLIASMPWQAQEIIAEFATEHAEGIFCGAEVLESRLALLRKALEPKAQETAA